MFRFPRTLLSAHPQPANYGRIFSTIPFGQALTNSVIVATTIGVGQAVLCALAGFAFAKLSFPGRNTLFLIVVLTMTVPAQLYVIPQYMIMTKLGWVDSLQAVIVPGPIAKSFCRPRGLHRISPVRRCTL